MYLYKIKKTAGKREGKKVSGLNFEEIKKRLLSEGIEPNIEEIKLRLLNKTELSISDEEKELIISLDLSESSRKRVNEIESALIIIGSVLFDKSSAKEFIDDFSWYLETFEFSPGDLKISSNDIKDISSIKIVFEKIHSDLIQEKKIFEENKLKSAEISYLSNDIVYDFGDGWRVVYVPAVKEMEPFPGYPNTSHDRVLEGNSNGLCLGSGMRYYQDNKSGKIYSVRDPSNKPRVTIRILNNKLEEAKGKNNNPPDISGAEKADIWFKTIKDFSYKNSNDYKSFPPLNIKDAKDLFYKDPYSPYSGGWGTYWYKKGVEELDNDIDRRIMRNDSILIGSGFGKHPAFFEKIKPTVIYWCNKYIDENSEQARNILFSSKSNHEVFKTYKKLNEMNLAVKKFASNTNSYAMYFYLGLHEIREYREYMDVPAKAYLEHDPLSFIESFYNKSWAQKYMNLAGEFLSKKLDPFHLLKEKKEEPWFELFMPQIIMSAINNDPVDFIKNFMNKSWAKEYLALAGAGYAKKDPKNFIYLLSKFEWAIPSLDVAGKSLAESEPKVIIDNYNKDWAKSHLELAAMNLIEKNPFSFLIYAYLQEMRPYINKAVNAALEKKPCYFLREYSNNDWAKPYLDLARKKCAENSPMNFMLNSKEDPLSKPYIELAIKNLVYGSDSLIETEPGSFLRYFSKEDWAKPYLDFAVKKYFEIDEDPFKFIKIHSTEPWAKPHLDFAAKKAIDFDPDYFLMSFKDREKDRGWVRPYIELAMEKSKEKKDDINLFANTYKNKLNIIKKLSLALKGLGLKSEANTIENLSGIPLYHGTDETFSLGRWKISKSGALGAGIYLTPSRDRAKSYGRNVIRAYASLEKPIIVDVGLAEGVDADPCIAALKALGVSEKAAISRVEKAYDERGYVSTGIKAVGEKLGYDGIMLYNKGELKEVVVWNAARISGAEIE